MSAEILQQSPFAKMRALLIVRTLLVVGPIGAVFALTLSTAARAATITVDSLGDTGATGICALRDAITAANTMTATNGCAAGTGSDKIKFSVTGTILLASTLPQVSDSFLAIDGPAAPGITIDGSNSGNPVRVMQVASGATLNLKNLTIAKGAANSASEVEGGGISNDGTLTLTGCTLTSNSGVNGGGIENKGKLTITNSTIASNGAVFHGGGVDNEGTMTVTSSTLSSNGGKGDGGGIRNNGTLTITNSTFYNNGVGGLGSGGAIANGGTVIVTASTFSGNSAGSIGGGISNVGTLTITNSTFSGNNSDRGGAGINNFGTLTVNSSTFSNNSVSFGFGTGDIENDRGSASLKSTILAGSGLSDNCSAGIADAGYNISDDASCGFIAIGSLNQTDPKLDPAGTQNNGGPTETIALASGSPAIDAIPVADCTDQTVPTPKPITTDQRGMPRPDAGEDVCDIGAFESQETFAGRPGAKNCHGVSVSALAHQFGSIDAAASALGFPSLETLQKAIRAFCRE